ncbi:MAG TPA: ABC transporter permease [Sedimentibacter sp.]|nr:ABC transporter permease [Sedimentibacter sp.]
MAKTIIHRFFWSIFVLIGLSIIIFGLLRIVPGDPARVALGPKASAEIVEAYREKMHLNESVAVQYVYWLKDVLHGDLGDSLITRRAVITDIKSFLPATIELVFFAGFIQILFGQLIGIFTTAFHNRWPDYIMRVISYIGVATPSFVMAVLLIFIFGYTIPVLPSIGGRISSDYNIPVVSSMMLIDTLIAMNFEAFKDAFLHILFPGLSLAIANMMQEAKMTKSSMVDNMSKDYIAMVTSQGTPKKVINSKYLLKPSIIPAVSIMGLDFAASFGNAFLVEQIFDWNGLSSYGITAIMQKDINAVCAVVLIYGVVFIIVNVIVDLIVAWLDPRMQQQISS